MDVLIFLIDLAANLYLVILLARVLLPLFGVDMFHPLMQWVLRLTEPVLGPIRAVLPQVGMFDLSPMVALILLSILQSVLIAVLGGG